MNSARWILLMSALCWHCDSNDEGLRKNNTPTREKDAGQYHDPPTHQSSLELNETATDASFELMNSTMKSEEHRPSAVPNRESTNSTTQEEKETNRTREDLAALFTRNVTRSNGKSLIIPTEEPATKGTAISLNDALIVLSFTIIFVVGSLGNALVCYVFRSKAKGKRSVTEYLLFNLGFVDLLASVTNPPLFVYWTLTSYSTWDFGYFGCKLFPNISIAATNLSAMLMMVLALDRYRAIMTPFRGHYRLSHIRLIILLAYALSIATCLHRMNLQTIRAGRCEVPDVTDLRFAVPALLILSSRNIIFIFVFVFSHVRIVRKLRASNLAIVSGPTSPQESDKEAKRIGRILLAMMCAFLLLVLPRDILHVTFICSWLAGNGISYGSVLLPLNAWLKVLHAANSCANVFIYSRMHNVFHDYLAGCWRCVISKKEFKQLPSEETVAITGTDSPLTPRHYRRRKSERSVLLDRVQSIFRPRPDRPLIVEMRETTL